MKKIYSYLAVAMLFGTLAFAQTTEISKDPKVLPTHNQILQKDNRSIKAYAEGEAIVVLKKNLSKSSVSSLLTQKGIKVRREYSNLVSKNNGSYLLVSGNTSTEALISEIQKDPNIESASPNYRRKMSAIPDDPKFGDLWGLNNTNDTDIDAPEAWNTETGSSDVVVAVFDTGVDYTHEDLSANMWVNSAEITGNGIDDDHNGYIDDVYGYDFAGNLDGDDDPDPMDIMGHGTHVSGTIGARGNNGKGITGVNWDVKIMALKVFRPDMGAYTSDILEAIDYVLEMKNNHSVNIVAINASYGGGGGSQGDSMDIAIQSLGDAGIIFAAAAGNDGEDNDAKPHYPSSYSASNIISVAATDQSDTLASFSNYGVTSVDIAAPGVSILSTLPSFNIPYNHTIFFDDVETGTNNWETSGTYNKWQITQEEGYSDSHAWSDSPGEDYNNSTDALLSYSLDIDLSAHTNNMIGLGACLKYELEEDWDYLYIEASGDSGSKWTVLGAVTGTQSNWACNGIVIPNNLKTANFRMRFRIKTDDLIRYDGVYIDNISIGEITPSNSYASWAGTSMATPHVAGAAALMAVAFPSENVTERRSRILDGADDVISLNGKVVTGGRLNIKNSIELSTPNTAPVAENDTATVVENGSVNISVLSNDSDADGDSLSISTVGSPANGTASKNGTQITYTPNSDYTGTDNFTYSISDGHGGTDTATVTVTVNAESSGSSGGGGGGCTYNPHNKNFDLMFIVMIMMSLFYPLKRKYLS